jgi:hypothetical protein
MKRLIQFTVMAIALAFQAYAVDLITATVTVTNTPSNGNTLTVNGSARTWKTSVVTASTDILIASGIGPTATNLYNQVAAYGFSGPLTLARSSTNAITLRGIPGQSMTLSSSGTWATITYATNTITDSYVFRVPFTTEALNAQTNIASLALVSLRDWATNSLTLTTAMQNFADTKTSQTLSNKTLSTGTYVKAGTITNTAVEQITLKYRSSSDIGADGYNGIYFTKNAGGDPWIIAPDSAGKPSLYNANATNPPVLAADYTPQPQNLLNLLIASNTYGGKAYANTWTGTNTFTRITNSTIVGSTLSQASSIDGYVSALTNGYWMSGGITNGTLTNTTIYGTHSMVGSQAYTRTSHTSLASGNNSAIDFGTGTYAVISSGPSAAFAIAGVANGANGRVYIIHNATSYTMSVLNDSGVDPTAGNRIYTNTGTDVSFSGASTIVIIYDSTLSRWVLVSSSDVDLASQANGNLPVANLGSGTGATSSTYWRGDGSWAALPSGAWDTNYYFAPTQFTTSSTNVAIISGVVVTNAVLYGSTSGKWTVGSTGNLTADTARTITTTTGALTLASGSGSIDFDPSGTNDLRVSVTPFGSLNAPRRLVINTPALTSTNWWRITPDDGSLSYTPGIAIYGYNHATYGGSTWIGYGTGGGATGKISLGLGPDANSGTARVEIDGVSTRSKQLTTSSTSITGSLVVGNGSTTANNVGIGEGNVNIGSGLAVGGSVTIGGSTSTGGAVTTARRLIKSVTAFTDATPKDLVTVSIPNGAHSAVVTIQILGSIGAGGAIGANEASASISYTFTLARRAGIATVVNASSAYGSSQASVAGGTSITITAAASSISGAVGVTQTFTIQGTITKGGGSSDNHTAVVIAELANANASGVTIQ